MRVTATFLFHVVHPVSCFFTIIGAIFGATSIRFKYVAPNMPLTSIEIKHLSPQKKDYWKSDEKGLRLLIKANGSKYWRMKYRFEGKQKTLALGVFPDVSLKDARIARDKARIQLAEGTDPNLAKQILRDKEKQFFSVLALEWWEQQRGTWSKDHANRLLKRLDENSFKDLDKVSLEKIKPQDILQVIHKVETRGALDIASRVLQDIRRVFRYGVQTGKIEHNPASELTGVLKLRKKGHHPSLPQEQLGQFLVELKTYEKRGRLLTRLALELLILTFVRSGELRGALWSEFDFYERIWRIPAKRMKMKTEHFVPLSKQAIRVLSELKPISGQYELVFPSEKIRQNPMSDNTMRLAMFRMGYDGNTEGKSRATPHGFRANASSILNEKGFNPDAIERQLSHMERNGVRAAYTHHARYLEERENMMQWWADYLDKVFSEVSIAP